MMDDLAVELKYSTNNSMLN